MTQFLSTTVVIFVVASLVPFKVILTELKPHNREDNLQVRTITCGGEKTEGVRFLQTVFPETAVPCLTLVFGETSVGGGGGGGVVVGVKGGEPRSGEHKSPDQTSYTPCHKRVASSESPV